MEAAKQLHKLVTVACVGFRISTTAILSDLIRTWRLFQADPHTPIPSTIGTSSLVAVFTSAQSAGQAHWNELGVQVAP